jgi:hypothetical protein
VTLSRMGEDEERSTSDAAKDSEGGAEKKQTKRKQRRMSRR